MVTTSFVFKTSNSPVDYIGFNKKPKDENGRDPSDEIYGIIMPKKIVCSEGFNCKILDEIKAGTETIYLLEDLDGNISDLSQFHNKYAEYTNTVKLVQGTNFSDSVKKLINAHDSGGSKSGISDKKTSVKLSKKKKSKKGGGKKRSKKKSAGKKPKKKKSSKKKKSKKR